VLTRAQRDTWNLNEHRAPLAGALRGSFTSLAPQSAFGGLTLYGRFQRLGEGAGSSHYFARDGNTDSSGSILLPCSGNGVESPRDFAHLPRV